MTSKGVVREESDAMLDKSQHNFQPTKKYAASTKRLYIHLKRHTNVFREKTKTIRREKEKTTEITKSRGTNTWLNEETRGGL